MKVLYIVPDTNRIGGVSSSILRVTSALQSLGVNVTIFSPDFEVRSGKIDFGMQGMIDQYKGLKMQLWTQRTIERIEEIKPDLVIGYHASTMGYCATAAASLLDVPVVVGFRGNDMNRDFHSSIHLPKLQFVAANANAITAVSSEIKLKVDKWLSAGDKTTFIPNSVNTDIFKYDRLGAVSFKEKWNITSDKVIGLFGEFKPSRGLDIIDKLEPLLSSQKLIIVGTVRKGSQNKILESAQLVPYITSKQELVSAYSACDIVLQPSKFDGMPNVVLEAMACERNVVASPTGGIRDVVKHQKNGYLCNSHQEWEDTLTKLLSEPNKEVGEIARKSVNVPQEEALAFKRVFESVL